MLRPDAGQILLGGEDITALAPRCSASSAGWCAPSRSTPVSASQRARGGDAGGLRARAASPRTWWRPLPPIATTIEEAYAILDLAAARRRLPPARPTSSPTVSSGCWRSRWRWPPSRRCCCSTSRPPACRARRAPNCSPPSPACRSDITVLFIEHDMELVFRFASRIIVMVGGSDPGGGHAGGNFGRPARARGLSRRGAAWLSRCLPSTTCAPATATRWCSTTSRSRWPSAAASPCSAATASASGRCC